MLGDQIRQHRRRCLLSQVELAARASLTTEAVRNIENDRGTVQSLATVLRCLNVQVSGLPKAGSIGERIKLLRTRQGHSQRYLCERTNISQPTLINLERSRGRLSSFYAVAAHYRAKLFVRDLKRSHFQRGETDIWNTHASFLELIHGVIPEFCIDPSSNPNSLVNARRHFYETDDGLTQEWKGQNIWLNPPYSTLPNWIDKAHHEYTSGNAKTIIALLPSRTNTSYFHEKIAGHADIIFIKKRLKFGTSNQQAPFPSILAIYGNSDITRELMKLIPGTLLPAQQLTMTVAHSYPFRP